MIAYSDIAERAPDLAGQLFAASGLLEDARFFMELTQLFERRGWWFMVEETLERACGRLVYATALIDTASRAQQREGSPLARR